MKFDTRKSVMTELKNYCHLAKPHDVIEVCEWANGEGFDVTIGEKQIALTYGELTALEVLTKVKHPK
jgi:hypothetical protein